MLRVYYYEPAEIFGAAKLTSSVVFGVFSYAGIAWIKSVSNKIVNWTLSKLTDNWRTDGLASP
jgi:hypothetical protein